jgi:D-glycero-D-manno-heptose 1,7-bisphosphate phosphatase
VLVILDRDGVINHDSPDAITTPEAWQPLPGSLQAIGRLHRAGCAVAIATNQSAVGQGRLSLATLDAIHERLRAAVRAAGGCIAMIAVCPHAPDAGCTCRKPRTGLLAQIERATGRSAAGAPFVGDSLRDLEAGRAYGCMPILVRTGNGARTEAAAIAAGFGPVFDDLAAATSWILETRATSGRHA